jgi:hypothetical protein
MNAIAQFPLSNLERERKDSVARDLQSVAAEIVDDPDHRWTDEELFLIGVTTQALKTFLMRNLPK